MKIRVLASSSRGCCYLVSDSSSPLLLECGIGFGEIKRALWGEGVRLAELAGALLTHEHMDHARSAVDLTRAGVDVYASRGTIEALGLTGHRVRPLRALEEVRVGTWTVLPFDTVHDAAEPLGFLLAGRVGKLLYLTDSAYCRYRFRGLRYLMVECNHSLDLLRQNVAGGVIDPALKARVLRNHMSLEHLLDMLRANDLSEVREIWLLHLSDQNSDAEAFKAAVQRTTGKPVYVAGEREGV